MKNKSVKKRLLALSLATPWLMFTFSPAQADNTHHPDRSEYLSPKSAQALNVDGIANEQIWGKAPWKAIDQRWLGDEFS